MNQTSNVERARGLMRKKMRPRLGLILPQHARMMKAIPLSVLLTGKVPRHPVVKDHYSKVENNFRLYQNDKYGNCGPVAVANQRGLISSYLTDSCKFPSQDDVFDLYRRSTRPPFNLKTGRHDDGVVMQSLCEELLRGGISGQKAVAFARVNLFNLEEVSAAVSIFGSVLIGAALRNIQEKQMECGVWDFDWSSPQWGGHAVLGCGYDKRVLREATGNVVTWGKVIKTTLPFIMNQIVECWVVIWPENLGTKQFQKGIDLESLKNAYNVVTRSKLVLP